jgi:hypothetical protein
MAYIPTFYFTVHIFVGFGRERFHGFFVSLSWGVDVVELVAFGFFACRFARLVCWALSSLPWLG